MTDLQAHQMACAGLRIADAHPEAPWVDTALRLVGEWFELDAAGRRQAWAKIIDLMTPAELYELAELAPAYWPLGAQLHPLAN